MPFGARDSGVSEICHLIPTLPYCRRCVDCCRWWMSLLVVVPHSSVGVCTVSVKSLVSQHVMVFIIVGCRLQSSITLFCCSRFGVCLTDIARISKSFVTNHALPHLAAALYHCYLNCCLLNSDTFLFHVYLRMMLLMPLTLFALADCC